jgi:hypothetical protein
MAYFGERRETEGATWISISKFCISFCGEIGRGVLATRNFQAEARSDQRTSIADEVYSEDLHRTQLGPMFVIRDATGSMCPVSTTDPLYSEIRLSFPGPGQISGGTLLAEMKTPDAKGVRRKTHGLEDHDLRQSKREAVGDPERRAAQQNNSKGEILLQGLGRPGDGKRREGQPRRKSGLLEDQSDSNERDRHDQSVGKADFVADGKLKGEGRRRRHRHGCAGEAAFVEIGDGYQRTDERVDAKKCAMAADLVSQEPDGQEGPRQDEE